MLTKGMQQKDIAKSLNVSEATITLDVIHHQ
jgi:DNA-binding NarL/FixJ family response regulator